MSEKENNIPFLPDRLNQEPTCFKGLTNTELFKTVISSILFWCPVLSITTSILFDAAILGLGLGVLMMLATVFFLGVWLQKYKRNLPDGLHEVKFRRWKQEKLHISSGYILSSKNWDIKRQNTR